MVLKSLLTQQNLSVLRDKPGKHLAVVMAIRRHRQLFIEINRSGLLTNCVKLINDKSNRPNLDEIDF